MSNKSMPTPVSFAIFTTAIGRCAIAWTQDGIVGAHLPEANVAKSRERMLRRFPEAQENTAPANVQRVIDGIVALLDGESVDFSRVALDMKDVPPFHRRVYEVALTIPAGETLTYGEVAKRVGVPGAARAVGQALGKNPFAPIVPCHRVLAANNRPGGFSASGGVATKMRMLAIEGVQRGLRRGNP